MALHTQFIFLLENYRVDGIWVTSSSVASVSIKDFLYLSVLLPFTYSCTSLHCILGLQLASLLQSLHLMWGLYTNIPSLIQVH